MKKHRKDLHSSRLMIIIITTTNSYYNYYYMLYKDSHILDETDTILVLQSIFIPVFFHAGIHHCPTSIKKKKMVAIR